MPLPFRRFAALAALAPLALSLAGPALADEVSGTLLAHDRKANRVVLESREIFEYDAEKTELPEELLAGSVIRITYRGGEDGVESIQRIEVVEPPADDAGAAADDAPADDAPESDGDDG